MHALFVYNSNPGAVAPNHNAVVRGLARADLFTVVHEQFFTDTTDYADYVLPATTFLEHTDIQGAYGHYFVQLSNQAIEPPRRSALQRVALQPARAAHGLHRRVLPRYARADHPAGAGHRSRRPLDQRQHGAHHARRSEGSRDTFRSPFIASPKRIRSSPTLRARCPRPPAKSSSIPKFWPRRASIPLPAFVATAESRWSAAAEKYPLELLGRKNDNYMNSTFANLDGHRKMESRTAQKLEMHPQDAEPRGIADGDRVRIYNDRGSLTLTALVNGSVPAGVVAARLDWAKLHPESNNVNALTSERLTDLGRAATFYSTLVEVAKA